MTNQNKLQYLNLLAQHKLSKSVKEEVEHFLKGELGKLLSSQELWMHCLCHYKCVSTGLNDVIPDHLLSIFDETELEVSPLCEIHTQHVLYIHVHVEIIIAGSICSCTCSVAFRFIVVVHVMFYYYFIIFLVINVWCGHC